VQEQSPTKDTEHKVTGILKKKKAKKEKPQWAYTEEGLQNKEE